jgi:hypothetical protein
MRLSMIKRRWKIWTCLVVFLLPLLYYFDLHLVLVGYLRNEPCYRWRPATYWRAQVESWYRWQSYNNDDWGAGVTLIVLEKLNIDPSLDDPIKVGDRSAVPVLVFLVQQSDLAHGYNPHVRGYAIGHLSCLDPPDDRAIPAIIEALSSADMSVRWAAVDALQAYGPKGREAVPKIVPLLKNDRSGQVRITLEIIDPEHWKSAKPGGARKGQTSSGRETN